MFLIIAVSLYTSRVVLKVLGVIDYGIYNVIGGVVALMGLLNGAMTSATNRFFSFELGKNDEVALKRIFSMSINIYIIVAVVFVFFAETLGLWFVNTQLVIPADRLYAANYAYQFSVISCIVTLFTIPFNASIIAHEDMNVFAYISIVEVLLKLGVVYLLSFFFI
jgi:Na+-driven multidrug efflux pump